MTIGAPISPAGKDPATLTQEVEAWIEAEVARLGRAAMSRAVTRDDVAYLRLDEVRRPRRARRAPRRAGAAASARRRARRLPADPRPPAHDRHGGRPDRPHRARAALGDAVRDRGGAAWSARNWIVKALAEWRGRRRDVMPREWKSGAPILYRGRELALEVFPARRARIAPDLFNLTVLHPRAQDETQVAAARRQVAARRSVALVAPQVARYAQRVTPRAPAAAAVQRAQRMGQLQRARRDPPQLAAGAAAAGARRVRRRARGRAPGRAQSLAALLGAGRDADARPRRAAARARGLDGAAGRVSDPRVRRRGAASATGRSRCPPARARGASASSARSSAERVSRQRPASARKWNPPERAATQISRLGTWRLTISLPSSPQSIVEDAVVEAPVDVGIARVERGVERGADRREQWRRQRR